jgi:hypothetical protein
LERASSTLLYLPNPDNVPELFLQKDCILAFGCGHMPEPEKHRSHKQTPVILGFSSNSSGMLYRLYHGRNSIYAVILKAYYPFRTGAQTNSASTASVGIMNGCSFFIFIVGSKGTFFGAAFTVGATVPYKDLDRTYRLNEDALLRLFWLIQ